jgi:thiamine biosynthesis protein ThiI
MSTVAIPARQRGVLIAFGELFLKSAGVRQQMLRLLARTLERQLERRGLAARPVRGHASNGARLERSHDRFFIAAEDSRSVAEVVRYVPGIAWYAEGFRLPQASLTEAAAFLTECAVEWIPKRASYALALRRGSGITLGREEILSALAEGIERKVDLTSPDREILVEVDRHGWFLAERKERGAGGLPVGSEGRVAVLVSGGIDSPVAAHCALKRGAENVWIHFHSFPLVSRKSIEKVRELAKKFLRFEPELRVHFVPLGDIQLKVRSLAPEKYRVLLYRRAMMRIAEAIAVKEGAGALVTGEALGQVGSQTLPNLALVEEATELLVLRPLVGFDKEEIIARAKEIGTYDISIQPQEDCCSLFVPKHPTAAGKRDELERIERELSLAPLIRAALRAAEVEMFREMATSKDVFAEY